MGTLEGFSFPSSESIPTKNSVSIERAGSVLIKYGFAKVPSFDTPQGRVLTPPLTNTNVAVSPSAESVVTDMSYNGQVCHVHDVMGVIEKDDLAMVGNIEEEGARERAPSVPLSVQSSKYSTEEASNKTSNVPSRSATVLFNPYAGSVSEMDSESVTSFSDSGSSLNPMSDSAQDTDLESGSSARGVRTPSVGSVITIPRRSSKRMRIYAELGVEPNRQALLEYVNSRGVARSPTLSKIMESPSSALAVSRQSKHESILSANMDNLTRMMAELDEIRGGEGIEEGPIVLSSQSTKSMGRLRSLTAGTRGTSVSALGLLNTSPLREARTVSDAVAPKMSVRRRSTVRRARVPSVPSMRSASRVLPALPTQLSECELKRSPAIKRKNRLFVVAGRVLRRAYVSTRKALQSITVRGKKLFAYKARGTRRSRNGKSRASKPRGPISISLPTKVNIQDTSFGPEVLSTFGAYGVGLSRACSVSSASTVPLGELKLSLKSVSLSTMTMDTADLVSIKRDTAVSTLSGAEPMSALADFWKLSLQEGKSGQASQRTLSAAPTALNYDDHAEELINLFVSAESAATESSAGSVTSNASTCSGSCGSYSGLSSSLQTLSTVCSGCSECDAASAGADSTSYYTGSSQSSHSSHSRASSESLKSSLLAPTFPKGIRPSMKMTNLGRILKEGRAEGSIGSSGPISPPRAAPATTWRQQLLGPRPMPVDL